MKSMQYYLYIFCLSGMLAFITPVSLWAQAEPPSAAPSLPILNDQVFDIGRGGLVNTPEILGATGSIFIFWSNQCAWTKRYLDRLEALAGSSNPAGVRIILVNSNNKKVFPREGLSESQAWERSHDEFIYLYDEGARVARSFGAERTPQVFAYDAQHRLVYVGAIDDSPGDPGRVVANFIVDVIDALQQGRPPSVRQTKPFGCQIRF